MVRRQFTDRILVHISVQGMPCRIQPVRRCKLDEETKNSEKKLEVEVKPYRSKRSLEQNKLLWVLLGKLAVAMSGKKNKVSSEEAYAIMLEEANVCK